MPYDLGATARLIADCRDPGGILSTAVTAVVTVALPDGTVVTPSATETGTDGVYQADYVTTVPGRHTVRWVFSGPAHAYTDSFDVREFAPPGILSLADGKKHLNKMSTGDDDEIRSWIESITSGIEGLCGPVTARTVVEVHDVRRARTIALRETPAIALSTLEPVLSGGASYDVPGLALDPETGIVQRLDGGMLSGPLRVTYTAGRRVVPAALTAAARIILQHLWRTQQGPGRPQMGVGDFDVTEPISGFGYAIPNRALQLMEPYRLPPGVA